MEMLLVFKVKLKSNSMVLGMHAFTRMHMYMCPLNCMVVY